MTMIHNFYIERKGETVKIIFPQPQRHKVNTYHKSPRRTYKTLETVYVSPLVLNVSKQTAHSICAAIKDDESATGTGTYWANDEWWLSIQMDVEQTQDDMQGRY